ncbi:hypothetical protein U1Q18_013454 [Sarracenia purpurea var. burkii]
MSRGGYPGLPIISFASVKLVWVDTGVSATPFIVGSEELGFRRVPWEARYDRIQGIAKGFIWGFLGFFESENRLRDMTGKKKSRRR